MEQASSRYFGEAFSICVKSRLDSSIPSLTFKTKRLIMSYPKKKKKNKKARRGRMMMRRRKRVVKTPALSLLKHL